MKKFAVVCLTLLAVSLSSFASTPTFSGKKSDFVPGEFIVKIKTLKSATGVGTMSVTTLGRMLGGVVKSRFAGDPRLFVLKKDSGVEISSILSELNSNKLIEYAEPNYIYHINRAPNDPDYSKTWGLHNTGAPDSEGRAGTAGLDVNMEKAWDVTTGSKDVVVAVIDTGIDYTHPDLRDNVWVNPGEVPANGIDDDKNGFVDDVHGYNFVSDTGDDMDDHGHGSHVSGTIGARGDDGLGVAGINWNVRIMGVKFLDQDGSGTLEAAVKAIDYATQMGARVESNSWGGGGYSQALKDSIDRANAKNVLFVAAAGNDGMDNDTNDAYPANYNSPNVMAVAAIDNQGNLADFSDWGRTKVHVAAPGVNVYSCVAGGTYDSWSGTSMATPHVSGIAALILSQQPKFGALELKSRIMKTARALPSLKGKVASGGMADAFAAVSGIIE